VAIPDPVLRQGARLGQVAYRLSDERDLMGPGADFWNGLRRAALPVAEHALGDRVMASVPVDEREKVGRIDADRETVEEHLWDAGFRRNPLSALKTRDGEAEVGSWAYREGTDAPRQLHVALFPAADGPGVDVYAHEEWSAINSDVAIRHYEAEDQRKSLGREAAAEMLPVDDPARPPTATDVPETGRLIEEVWDHDGHDHGVDDPERVAPAPAPEDTGADALFDHLREKLGDDDPDESGRALPGGTDEREDVTDSERAPGRSDG